MTSLELLPDLAQTPNRLRVRARILLVVGVALTCAFMFLPWVQTASGTGQVVPLSPKDRAQRVDAPVSGRISEWRVLEGDTVKAGAVIATLVDVDPAYFERLRSNQNALQNALDATEAQGKAYRDQLVAQRRAGELSVEAARQRVGMAQQKLEAAKQSVKAADVTLHVAEVNVDRVRGLVSEGLSSKRDLELAQLKVAESKASANKAMAASKEMAASLLAYRAAVHQKKAEVTVKLASSEASLQKATQQAAKAGKEFTEMEIKISRQASQVVLAPVDGNVLWINHELSGGIIKKGEKLVVIVPHHARPAVELWMDGNDLPLLQPGRAVRLQFEGWPAVQFDGWPSVAVGNFPGTIRAVDSASQKDGRFRVVIVPDNEGAWPSMQFLRQGVRVNGIALLDEVRVGYELWRLLNDFPPRLETPNDASVKEKKGDGQ